MKTVRVMLGHDELSRCFFLLAFVIFFAACVAAKTKPAQPWRAVHLLDYNTDAQLDALGHAGPKLFGYLFTTWGVNKDALVEFPPLIEGLKPLRDNQRPS